MILLFYAHFNLLEDSFAYFNTLNKIKEVILDYKVILILDF